MALKIQIPQRMNLSVSDEIATGRIFWPFVLRKLVLKIERGMNAI